MEERTYAFQTTYDYPMFQRQSSQTCEVTTCAAKTWASRPEELHLWPLTEQCVNLSIHTAPIKHAYLSHDKYHGKPYVTHYLFPEMFEGASTIADIPAAVVRKRLPHALELADLRERTVYQGERPRSAGRGEAELRRFRGVG